jgi:hypothetical protein
MTEKDKQTQHAHRTSRSALYLNMWPIALAPSIPLVGLIFKNQPKVRNVLIAAIGGGTLLYAHSAALGSSKDISG